MPSNREPVDIDDTDNLCPVRVDPKTGKLILNPDLKLDPKERAELQAILDQQDEGKSFKDEL